jgi:hypothetical protein
MAKVTKMNSLRQLVPKELEVDITRLTHLDTWAAMKKYVLDQVVVRREPYFIQNTGGKKHDHGVVPMDVGNVMNQESDDENKSYEEENQDSSGLNAFKGSGKGFAGNCHYCWKFGHRMNECHQKTADMAKSKGKGFDQDKGKGKGNDSGFKGYGKGNGSKGDKGYGKGPWTHWSPPRWAPWGKAAGKGLSYWGEDPNYGSTASMPLFSLSTSTPVQTKNQFEVLNEEEEEEIEIGELDVISANNIEWPELRLEKDIFTVKPVKKQKLKKTDFKDFVHYLGAPDVEQVLNHVGENGWSSISAIMDSGAAESVAPLDFVKHIPIKESEGSRRGQVYHAADGNKIANRGEKVIEAVTEDGLRYHATYQIAAVTRPLNSISKICDQGNMVIFNRKGGYVLNEVTGEQTHFSREQGVYVMHSWIHEGGGGGSAISPFARPEM